MESATSTAKICVGGESGSRVLHISWAFTTPKNCKHLVWMAGDPPALSLFASPHHIFYWSTLIKGFPRDIKSLDLSSLPVFGHAARIQITGWIFHVTAWRGPIASFDPSPLHAIDFMNNIQVYIYKWLHPLIYSSPCCGRVISRLKPLKSM